MIINLKPVNFHMNFNNLTCILYTYLSIHAQTPVATQT